MTRQQTPDPNVLYLQQHAQQSTDDGHTNSCLAGTGKGCSVFAGRWRCGTAVGSSSSAGLGSVGGLGVVSGDASELSLDDTGLLLSLEGLAVNVGLGLHVETSTDILKSWELRAAWY